MMKCIAICHLAFEDLGLFEPALRRLGWHIEYRYAGELAADAGEWLDADLVVVLGGPIAATDCANYPFLTQEIAGLRARIAAGRASLGLCLGAQLIALALGAPVYRAPTKEIGWSPIILTDAGRQSALGHLHAAPVLHWHGDTFDLPAGATLLASTDMTPNQAFSIGDRVLALQFHPEVDPDAIEGWLVGHAVELASAGVDVPALRAETARHAAAATRAGLEFFCAWLRQAVPG